MRRLLLMLLALIALAAPARADDISAAGRSVVRVVVIVFEEGEVAGFGHGSGFAVAPNRIVTNAHVVAPALEGRDVAIVIVPSEGAQGVRAHIVTADPARDLALLELDQRGSIPPIPLYTGPLDDGAPVAALGYPGNVDLATARSAEDYILPLPPTRSVGIFSNVRPINGITTLLHTANIARGHSGGPLLDSCGRVLGVNTLITRNQEGDAPFAFAVANRELTAFLRGARQPFLAVDTECVSMAERLRQDQQRGEDEARARAAAAAAAADKARDSRALSLAQVQESRETRLAIAILFLVLALVGFGGAGIMVQKDRLRPAKILGGAGAGFLLLAIIAFLARPSLAAAEREAPANSVRAAAPQGRFAGRNLCRLVRERSRVTVSATGDVPLDWADNGCVNARTQYARNGEVWTRILVPNGEQAVSVLQFTPATGDYVVTRYLLDAATMARVRGLRHDVGVKSCTPDAEARTILADQQREIDAILPHLPNERLVYACENQGAAPAPAAEHGN